jgi:hypothetical protein
VWLGDSVKVNPGPTAATGCEEPLLALIGGLLFWSELNAGDSVGGFADGFAGVFPACQ